MTSVQLQRATTDSFSPYGTVVRLPEAAPTAATSQFSFWSEIAHYHIVGETEIGLCKVHQQPSNRVTWVERHVRTPEILVPFDSAIMLPVAGGVSAETVEAFRIEVGEAVVINTGVWHSACHPTGAGSATYFVIFRRGTPRDDVAKVETLDVAISD